MEVIFLFLDWLSTFAHITVKDGNQMELTSMAKGEQPPIFRVLLSSTTQPPLFPLNSLYNYPDHVTTSIVMAPTLMRPYGRDAKVEELPAMIAAVFNLLEDQHIYHGESGFFFETSTSQPLRLEERRSASVFLPSALAQRSSCRVDELRHILLELS